MERTAELERKLRELTTLLEVSRVINADLDLERVLHTVLTQAVTVLEAEGGALWLSEPDGVVPRVAVGPTAPTLARVRLQPGEGIVGQVISSGRGSLLADARQHPAWAGRVDDATGFVTRSLITVPLTTPSGPIGCLQLINKLGTGHFQPSDLDLLTALSAQAALAVDNARLYHAAQQALQAREEFLALAGHELRGPLAPLVVALRLAQTFAPGEGQADGDMGEVLEIANDAAHRLVRLIDTLVDLSRLERGQLVIEQEAVDLRALAEQVVAEQQVPDRLTLKLRSTHEPIVVAGDPVRLGLVLHNLIQNAIKYSPEGGVITVEIERSDQQAVMVVGDEGIGIPDAAQPHLFERFYRASNVVGSGIGGMGIGLYLVKAIVDLHGGTIAVESTAGQGSRFTVRLPLPDAACDEPSGPAPGGAGSALAGPQHRS